MLPSETMLLTHPHLRFVWHARRAERSLLTYEEDERMHEIVQEPAGGAHRDPAQAARNVGDAIRRHLAQLKGMTPEQLVADRYRKFRAIGVYTQDE